MHRYSVTYIERSGSFTEAIVYARSKREARRKAADRGLDDIKRVKRVGFSLSPILVIALVVAVIVFMAVR